MTNVDQVVRTVMAAGSGVVMTGGAWGVASGDTFLGVFFMVVGAVVYLALLVVAALGTGPKT